SQHRHGRREAVAANRDAGPRQGSTAGAGRNYHQQHLAGLARDLAGFQRDRRRATRLSRYRRSLWAAAVAAASRQRQQPESQAGQCQNSSFHYAQLETPFLARRYRPAIRMEPGISQEKTRLRSFGLTADEATAWRWAARLRYWLAMVVASWA